MAAVALLRQKVGGVRFADHPLGLQEAFQRASSSVFRLSCFSFLPLNPLCDTDPFLAGAVAGSAGDVCRRTGFFLVVLLLHRGMAVFQAQLPDLTRRTPIL